MTDAFLPFSKPCIDEATIQEVLDCLNSGWLATGPRVKQFTDDLKKYLSLPSQIKIGSFLKSVDNKKILNIMKSDKKNKDSQIRFVLLKNIGEILLDVNAKPSQIYSAITKTKKLFN